LVKTDHVSRIGGLRRAPAGIGACRQLIQDEDSNATSEVPQLSSVRPLRWFIVEVQVNSRRFLFTAYNSR